MSELELGKHTVIVEDLQEKEDGIYYWVPEKIEIDPEKDLLIDDTDVDGELAKMGHVLAYYGDIAARLKAQFARKEEDLEAIEAELDKEIRDSLLTNQPKDPRAKPPTETQIKKMIVRHEKYLQGIGILQSSRLYYYRVDNLLKACAKKADALNCLGYNQRAERKNF